MSAAGATGAVKAEILTSQAPIEGASAPQKGEESLLQTLKQKFIAGKDYVLKHKSGFAKLGQIGGTAGLVTGGMSLLFSGIAANLTVGGIPLGIPLMVGGGILLAAGTVLQVLHQTEKKGSTVGEKIKGFFKETFNNIKLGTLAGVGVSVAVAITPLAKLVALVPCMIKLKSSVSKGLNKEENWKKFVESFSEHSPARKLLNGTKTLDDFTDKITRPIEQVIERAEKDTTKSTAPAEISQVKVQDTEALTQEIAVTIPQAA